MKTPSSSLISFFCLGSLLLVPLFSQAGYSPYSLPTLMRCTRDAEIVRAFRLLENSQGASSLHHIVNKPVRVIFKDMATLGKNLRNYDALSWMSFNGEQMIFINQKHKNAPPEALAALIAHEALHDDAQNSLQEEVASWAFEATVWKELSSHNVTLKQIPPGLFPLLDRERRIETEAQRGTLDGFVRKNAGYQGLPESSPGYEKAAAQPLQ